MTKPMWTDLSTTRKRVIGFLIWNCVYVSAFIVCWLPVMYAIDISELMTPIASIVIPLAALLVAGSAADLLEPLAIRRAGLVNDARL